MVLTPWLIRGIRNGKGVLSQVQTVPPLSAGETQRTVFGQVVPFNAFDGPTKLIEPAIEAWYDLVGEWRQPVGRQQFRGGDPIGKGLTFSATFTPDPQIGLPALVRFDVDVSGSVDLRVDGEIT